MKILFPLSTTVIILILCGCASAPDYEPPELAFDVPGQFKEVQAEGRAGNNWLQSFNDDAMVRFVNRVLEKNYSLKIAATRLENARNQVSISAANRLPNLDMGFNATQSETYNVTLERSVSRENYSLGPGLSWELDFWGKLRNSTNAAIAELQNQAYVYYNARLSLAANAAQAWYSAVTARKQLELAEESARSFEESARLIRRRYERNLSSSLELRLALANAANAQASLQNRRQNYSAALRTMQVLMADYPDGDIVSGSGLPPLDDTVPAGLPSELIQRRPDILSAERQLAATDQRRLRAWKELLPTLRFTASGSNGTNLLRDVVNFATFGWRFGESLSQPIFEGGRIRAAARDQKVNQDRAELQYAQTVLTAFEEVEHALATEQYLKDREKALRESVEQSVEAERLAWDRYTNGLNDIITVLESQRRALNSRTSLFDVQNARLQNRLNLFLSLGGSYDSDEGLETVPYINGSDHAQPQS